LLFVEVPDKHVSRAYTVTVVRKLKMKEDEGLGRAASATALAK